MGSCIRSAASHQNGGPKVFNAARQTSLAARPKAYLRNGRAASNARHSESPLWLGHSNLTTTEVYVRADPTEKLEAIEAVVPPSLRKGKFRPPDKLLALLKAKS